MYPFSGSYCRITPKQDNKPGKRKAWNSRSRSKPNEGKENSKNKSKGKIQDGSYVTGFNNHPLWNRRATEVYATIGGKYPNIRLKRLKVVASG